MSWVRLIKGLPLHLFVKDYPLQMNSQIPRRIPRCAVNLLARAEWFADPLVVSRARLGEAKGISRLLSSRMLAGQEIGAITLGTTIYYRQPQLYNPHTVQGLAVLAHELKHVEQYERNGWLKFYARYIWDFRSHGYGESVSFEAEAYEFQRRVETYLLTEFEYNFKCRLCQEMVEPHTPNSAYIKTAPPMFQYP